MQEPQSQIGAMLVVSLHHCHILGLLHVTWGGYSSTREMEIKHPVQTQRASAGRRQKTVS